MTRGKSVFMLKGGGPGVIRRRNPVDIWPAATRHGVEFAYREGMKAVLEDASINAVVPVLWLTADMAPPPRDFLPDPVGKYPEKPIDITFPVTKI